MLEYRKAAIEDTEQIWELVQDTIQTVYPKYYPKEVTGFFCGLHNRENIMNDIEKGCVYILLADGVLAGTGSCMEAHITRVYVPPRLQGKGYGTYIMQCLEKEVAARYHTVNLDASAPAGILYEHLGYKTVKHEKLQLENGVFLVYEIMEKNIVKNCSSGKEISV